MNNAPLAIHNARSSAPMNIMAVAPQKPIHDDDIKFYVRDLTATGGERVHVMLDDAGKQVPFKFHDQYTKEPIPYRFAVKFAAIPSFEVTDNQERYIVAVPGEAREANGIRLKNSECIANLAELTQGALLERATRAGGKFKSNAGKAEIVAFLTAMVGLKIMTAEEKLHGEVQETDDDGGGIPAGEITDPLTGAKLELEMDED